MDNVNKPVAISVAATVIVCIAAVTLLVLLGGLAWWLWAMDRATQWETLRPLIATGFIIWGDGTQPAGTGVYGLSTADKR
ncbi:type VI secretion protein VasK [Klebsiella pneumoniae]|nr:type VI secretion protein VasK [Klebsiella pneumoniae]